MLHILYRIASTQGYKCMPGAAPTLGLAQNGNWEYGAALAEGHSDFS